MKNFTSILTAVRGRERPGKGCSEAVLALSLLLQILPDTPPHRPRSEVVWIKDGQVIDTSSRKYRNFGKKKWLLIRDLTETDGGVYECAFTPNATEKGRAELWSEWSVLGWSNVPHY